MSPARCLSASSAPSPASACATSANSFISSIRQIPSMVRSSQRFRIFIAWLVATAGLIVVACFTVNCLVDPLWYLSGNILTNINYSFNERLSKLNRLLPHLRDYDCVIFGTSRATLLPEDKADGYRCFNLAFSDGQATDHLLYPHYFPLLDFPPPFILAVVPPSHFSR